MTSKLISGNRTAEDIIRAYYTKLKKPAEQKNEEAEEPESKLPRTKIIPQSSGNVFTIPRDRILVATSAQYREFLREAGYADLDNCSKIEIDKGLLKYNPQVRDAGFDGTDDTYVVNINQTDGRKLVETLGGRLLTTKLMYGLFIPFLEELAKTKDKEAKKTLKEMEEKAEWLDDIVLNKGQSVRIQGKDSAISLSAEEGYFTKDDLDDFGYPQQTRKKGRHYLWRPGLDENAAVRDWSSGLGLDLDWTPSNADDRLGVRVAKIFP